MTSRELDMDRVEAERFPCPYVLPSPVRRDDPKRCGAGVGERCRDPRTGKALERFPAHMPRLRAAGVAASSTVPGRVPGATGTSS